MSRAGVAFGWSLLDSSTSVDYTAARIDLYGEWLAPAIGAGGYAILPVSYARLDPDMGATNAEWVVGDAELGAVGRRPLGRDLEMAAHLGVTLPTAPESTLSATEITGFANSFAIWARPNDLVQADSQATYLRLGVSPMHLSGNLFVRADLAVDVPVHSGIGDDLLTLGRLNAAVGARLDKVALLAELVDLVALEKPDSDEEDRLLSFLGLTFRYTDSRWQPTMSLVLPLDQVISESVDLALVAGVDVMLP